jgi:hypothetical protein
MDLQTEVVEYANLISCLEQLVRQMGADESCPSRDQHPLRHVPYPVPE